MIIRKATRKDSDTIATLLLLAMEDITYKLVTENDYDKARRFLKYFIEQENNQYSYENCTVVEADTVIIAAVNIYDGGQLETLRAPIIKYIKTFYNSQLHIENETQNGEFYIDALGVCKTHQGQGIGSKLLQHLIQEYVVNRKETLGLLVDKRNPNAKKLYLKLGFKPVGEKELLSYHLDHLQIRHQELQS
ncbi:GNAT family N-acetyltransferase [Bizionia gelidisalsuginis]|uniref:GNAT family N-acetyltransferase n=1 Tax=Bizionia gelidisalsuginis TaxID=291188 RepID=A0ABY3MDQ0_9FLAO|nr:N-acetyltransferase [Bizionia gelidisalsuginis]TYC17061.1 GNAT family N-acetyltransferase [Bizionia gelidisalsuginis]